jgi:hypothetical protein
MAPIPTLGDASIEQQLNSPATHFDVQTATESISSTLRIVIMILAGLTIATVALYCLLRTKRRTLQMVCPGTPLLVYESSVSIEFDEPDDDEETIIDIEDYGSRDSFETILSNGTPRKLAFDINKYMPFLSRRRTGILDRRGKTTLRCDTTAYYETDLVPTATKSPIDRKVCRPKVHFAENVVSPLSPFWARQKTITSPFSRPIFGFNSKTITPPSGSPMWSGRVPARAAAEIPARRKDFWTP